MSKSLKYIGVVISGFALLYLISCGPLMFAIYKYDIQWMDDYFWIMKPHGELMYHSEGYYNYCYWWAGLGNDLVKKTRKEDNWSAHRSAVDRHESEAELPK